MHNKIVILDCAEFLDVYCTKVDRGASKGEQYIHQHPAAQKLAAFG